MGHRKKLYAMARVFTSTSNSDVIEKVEDKGAPCPLKLKK